MYKVKWEDRKKHFQEKAERKLSISRLRNKVRIERGLTKRLRQMGE